MPKLVDPDSLVRNTEIVFDTSAKTIQLLIAGNLSDTAPGKTSGVTLQAVYSKCKELWLSAADLRKIKFPLEPITEVKFDLINGWSFLDAQTKDLIRDGGWSIRNTAGIATEEYMGIISLGTMDDSGADLGYYQQVIGFDQTVSTFDKTGEINEAVLISGSGPVDYDNFFKIYLREQGKTYAESNLLIDQDIATLDYTVYRIPLSNDVDPKITESDANIGLNAPYTGMTMDFLTGSLYSTYVSGSDYVLGDVVYDGGRWFRVNVPHNAPALRTPSASLYEVFPGERQIGASYYAYNRIVDGNAASLENIYEWGQYQLRQTSDINADTNGDAFGTVNGNVAAPLFGFVGDTLVSRGGVFIDNFNSNDTNRIQLADITVDGGGLSVEKTPLTTTIRTFPFVAAGTMVFNVDLVNDADAEYVMYFTNDDAGDNAGADYDTVSAIIVNDNSLSPISGLVTTAEIGFTYDYDNNIQRGAGSVATNAPVSLVGIGLSGSQWVVGEFTITRATGLRFPLNAAKERVYKNE